MGEAGAFSRRVIGNIDYAVGKDTRSAAEIITAAGMSKNYFYTRMRGEKPFNTNDVEAIADALGIDPFELMRAPGDNVTQLDSRRRVRAPKQDEQKVARPRSRDRGGEPEAP